MKSIFALMTASVALILGTLPAHGQSFNFNFSGGTADGWANSGFGNSPAATVSGIGGTNYIFIPIGGFQVANVAHGSDGSAFYNTMQAAAANPSGYTLSYNWRVDTSTFGASSGTFLQIGSFVNTGGGYYAQHTSEVQLNGAQLASGQVFSGTVSENMGADISITPVPEPSMLSLFGLAMPAFWIVRRRRSNHS
jgi:hypothetical protein